ncbi:MAG: bifunctional ADP-heptose synthase [Bacteroidales bacterium]
MFEGFDFPKFFKSISNKKILIIGDVMIDTYLWGNVDRVSPEAPVPIVSDIVEESRLGGAANVALNVKSMGAVPILCSVIGGDEKGTVFLHLLEEQNLSDVGITVDDYRITTQKTRVISGFKHLLRIDEEIENSLSKRIQDNFIEMVLNLIQTGGIDAIIFQDYDKGVITQSIISRVCKLANKLHIPIMADPKYRNFRAYKNITTYKPNLKEFVKGVKIEESKSDIGKIVVAGEKFRSEQQIDTLMITLSEQGILVMEQEGHHHFPAVKRKIIDVSGAGDTVISVLALCQSGGMTPPQAGAVANLAGGEVCEKSGVVPVNREQLETECTKYLGSE